MPDVHRFGDVRRTEVDDDGPWLRRLRHKGTFGASLGLKRLGQRRGFEAKIDEACPRQFHTLAPFTDVELRHHLTGDLARIHPPLLGKRYQRVALVVAELWVGARADQQRGGLGARQNLAGGLLQTILKQPVNHEPKSN